MKQSHTQRHSRKTFCRTHDLIMDAETAPVSLCSKDLLHYSCTGFSVYNYKHWQAFWLPARLYHLQTVAEKTIPTSCVINMCPLKVYMICSQTVHITTSHNAYRLKCLTVCSQPLSCVYPCSNHRVNPSLTLYQEMCLNHCLSQPGSRESST